MRDNQSAHQLGDGRVSRRGFLGAGAAAGAAIAVGPLVAAGPAAAAAFESDVAPPVLHGRIVGQPSNATADVALVESKDVVVRLELADGATVIRGEEIVELSDFASGEGVVAFGKANGDGSVLADRVVPGVFGDFSDVRR